jgi:hypothetical protein
LSSGDDEKSRLLEVSVGSVLIPLLWGLELDAKSCCSIFSLLLLKVLVVRGVAFSLSISLLFVFVSSAWLHPDWAEDRSFVRHDGIWSLLLLPRA